MEQRYRSHIEYVRSVVPAENLLIYNIKDGWEPICKFLNVPVPNEPVPRKNTNGELFEEYAKTPFVQNVKTVTIRNFAILSIFIIISIVSLVFWIIEKL
jgi:hypothetical protein